MNGNKIDMIITDEIEEIENLLEQLEDWSSDLFSSGWRDLENSGSISKEWYEREKNKASKRNYERMLTIEKLREKLLCHG